MLYSGNDTQSSFIVSRVASPAEPVHELVQEASGEGEKSRRFVFKIDSVWLITGAGMWPVGKVVVGKMA